MTYYFWLGREADMESIYWTEVQILAEAVASYDGVADDMGPSVLDRMIASPELTASDNALFAGVWKNKR